jgi:hypothetical protein
MDMNANPTHGQEDTTMTATPIKHSRIGLAVAVVVTALGLVASAQARVPVEPGPGSPVTHQHVRVPAKKHVKRSAKRLEGGFPAVAGQHVKSQAEARTE